MPYITIDELTTAIGSSRINGFFPETGDSQAVALNAVITRASETVDGYLSPLYLTPVPASGFIRELCLSVALWQIHCKRGSGASVPERIRQAYEDALKDLRDIATGKCKVGGATPATAAPDTGSGIEVSSDEPMLDSSGLAGF